MLNGKWLNGKLENPRSGFISDKEGRPKGFSSKRSKDGSLKGFTLVELLVVITLVTLLSAAVYASYTRALTMGRDGRRRVDLASLRDALELYYFDYKSYPTPVSCNYPTYWCDVSSLGALVPTYIKVLPSDPKPDTTVYRYTYLSGGQRYCLEANLEIPTTIQNNCGADVTLQTGYDYGVGSP